MPAKRPMLLGLVLIWAALVAASFYFAAQIDGPRNLDTGFKRLDTLIRFQALALVLALITAAMGYAWRGEARRMALLGFTPLIITALAVAALALTTVLIPKDPPNTQPPPKPTAPASN